MCKKLAKVFSGFGVSQSCFCIKLTEAIVQNLFECGANCTAVECRSEEEDS